MIDTVVKYVVDELNDYIRVRSGVDEGPVMAAHFYNNEGQLDTKTRERVVLGVVNLEADRVYHSVETIARRPNGVSQIVKPEINLNVYLLFAGNFAVYGEALKAISLVIAFFQHHSAFDYSSIEGLEGKKGRVAFEMFSPTFEQQNHLWGALGTKYLPSVLYKAGLVVITDEFVEGEAPAVEEILINEGGG